MPNRKNGKLKIESTNPDWCGEWLQQEVEAKNPDVKHFWLDYVLERNFEDADIETDVIADVLNKCTNASLHMKINGDEVYINYENFPYAS